MLGPAHLPPPDDSHILGLSSREEFREAFAGEFRPQRRTGHAQNSSISDSMKRRPVANSSIGMNSSG